VRQDSELEFGILASGNEGKMSMDRLWQVNSAVLGDISRDYEVEELTEGLHGRTGRGYR